MRLVPLFLFGLLLQFPLVLTEISLHWQKKETRRMAKHVINNGLAESELILISSKQAGSEFTWMKPNEFAFRGMLYDIVRTEICPGDTLYYCWPDYAESRIKKMLDSFHEKFWHQNPVRQDQQSKVWSFYQQLFFHPLSSVFIPFNNQFYYPPKPRLEGDFALRSGNIRPPFTPPDTYSLVM